MFLQTLKTFLASFLTNNFISAHKNAQSIESFIVSKKWANIQLLYNVYEL